MIEFQGVEFNWVLCLQQVIQVNSVHSLNKQCMGKRSPAIEEQKEKIVISVLAGSDCEISPVAVPPQKRRLSAKVLLVHQSASDRKKTWERR